MMSTDELGYSVNRRTHKILPYTVTDWSSYSPGYAPEKIMTNAPTEQSNRWSSAAADQHQFIVLKLEKPAILETITFGKFYKNHVCNLREFKVYVRPHDGVWTEVLNSGLFNDSEPECFPLAFPSTADKCASSLASQGHGSKSNAENLFPVDFVQIRPLATWGNNFNFSIWSVELRGDDDPERVRALTEAHHLRLQRESWRICLKFLRDQPLASAEFASLQGKVGLPLEGILVGQLHDFLINKGDFVEAEQRLFLAFQEDSSLFSEYIENSLPYQPLWKRLDNSSSATTLNSNGVPRKLPAPSGRGGHQMCFDPVEKQIYLIGGWDGQRDLGDFWRYSLLTCTWQRLSENTFADGGPTPRSCHKIVLHTEKRLLLTIGRFVDADARSHGANTDSDFYSYSIAANKWTKISANTAGESGPALIYDHQMVLDELKDTIYVFGGRKTNHSSSSSSTSSSSMAVDETIGSSSASAGDSLYSGLYSYSIASNKWRLLRSDDVFVEGTPNIKSRIGHSMVFDQVNRKIYILAGQRAKDQLDDFYSYDVDSDTIVKLIKNTLKFNGPEPGFTQRTTFDPLKQELFLFAGLQKEKSSNMLLMPPPGAVSANGRTNSECRLSPKSSSIAAPTNSNNIAVYKVQSDKWIKIYSTSNYKENPDAADEPCPRFAHQITYDASTRRHYVFGGNPGDPNAPRKRLSDFWELLLVHPKTGKDIMRQCSFLIRRQKFYELCLERLNSPVNSGGMVDAMRFLQSTVSQAVDHSDAKESEEFKRLSSWLLNAPVSGQTFSSVRESRLELFLQISLLLPAALRPPLASISDLLL